MPYDGDANDLEGTAISMNAVVAALESSNARESFAVVDACFSGQGDRSVLAPGLRPLVRKRELPVAPKVALFSASTSTETSGAVDGAGIFTKFVTQALSTGQADSDGDGQLSLEELASWVKPRVSRVARRGNRQQTPTLTLPAGMGAEDFIVGWGYPAQ